MSVALQVVSQVTFSKEVSFVNVRTLIPPPLEEIRYATSYNFTKVPLYPIAVAFLHPDAAKALHAVQCDLARKGLGLKIYDAYRPLSVQQHMWELARDRRFVSNPAVNQGRHTRGTSVDVTLVDEVGNELPMPSYYDEFSERAFRNYEKATKEQKRNRKKLETVMARHGFIPHPYEWWHFDLRGWEDYPALDVPLEKLVRASKK